MVDTQDEMVANPLSLPLTSAPQDIFPAPLPSVAPPAVVFRRASFEDVEDVEAEVYSSAYSTASSMSSSAAASARNSIMVEEETKQGLFDSLRQAPLCRRDISSEVAQSLWGLVMPKNHAQVMPGVYRSGFPNPENFSFLKTLGLKSILTLVPEQYDEVHQQFVMENGIQHFQIGIEPNKDPFVTISQCNMSAALGVVLDRSNHPLLIHCNKGKHRTGCVVGCLRKIMGWELSAILLEYHRYADPKARKLDERFIELFDERAMLWLARRNYFAPAFEPINDSPISAMGLSTRLRG